jgi:hypothetical protein
MLRRFSSKGLEFETFLDKMITRRLLKASLEFNTKNLN